MLRLFAAGLRVASHFSEPAKITEDLPAFGFEEKPEVAGLNFFSVLAGEGFQAPAEVFATPRAETVAASCRPEESETGYHVCRRP